MKVSKNAKLLYINRDILSQKQKLSRLIQSPRPGDTEVTSPFSSSFIWSPKSRSNTSSPRQSLTSSNLSSPPSSPKITLRFPFLKLKKLKHATSAPDLRDGRQTDNNIRSPSSGRTNHSPVGLGISYIDFAHQSEALSFITSALDTPPPLRARSTNHAAVKSIVADTEPSDGIFGVPTISSAKPSFAKKSPKPTRGPRLAPINTDILSPTPRQRQTVSHILPGARSSTFCRALTEISFSEPITSADLQFSESLQAHQELYDRFRDDAPRPRQNSGSTESSGWNTPGLCSDFDISDDEDVFWTWKQSPIVKKIQTATRFKDGRITREASRNRFKRSPNSPRKVVFFESPSSSLGTVVEQPETYAKALEDEITSLRTTLGLPPNALPYTGPTHLAHPNHPFTWNYQNLRCVRCPSPASIPGLGSSLLPHISQSGTNNSPSKNFQRPDPITCAICAASCCAYSALLSLVNSQFTPSTTRPPRRSPITPNTSPTTARKSLSPSSTPSISYAISTAPNSPATSTFPTDTHAHHTLDRLRALPGRVCDGRSTFLKCASETCGRIVCAGCCGRCEEEVCGSIICVSCKESSGVSEVFVNGREELAEDGEVVRDGGKSLDREEKAGVEHHHHRWRCAWHE